MYQIELSADHKYTVNGKPFLGVTTVLKTEGFIDDQWYTEQARIRGDYVHKATQLIDTNTLDESTVDPLIQPFLKAYEDFVNQILPAYVYTEKKVCDPIFKWAGTLDRAGYFGKVPFLLDIKSGYIQPWCRLQTAAYLDGLIREDKNFQDAERYGLQLKADGTFKLHKYDSKQYKDDLKTFRNAVSNSYWKQNNL